MGAFDLAEVAGIGRVYFVIGEQQCFLQKVEWQTHLMISCGDQPHIEMEFDSSQLEFSTQDTV